MSVQDAIALPYVVGGVVRFGAFVNISVKVNAHTSFIQPIGAIKPSVVAFLVRLLLKEESGKIVIKKV